MFPNLNEGANPGMHACTDTKILFHKDNLIEFLTPEYWIFRIHIHFKC